MTPFEATPAIRLRSAYLRMHRATNRAFRPFDMTADQYVVLRFLAEHKALSQQELVELCASDPTTMGRMIDLLEKKGLVDRQPHLTDRRTYRVMLTKAGRAMRNRLYRAAAGVRATLDGALPPSAMQTVLSGLKQLSAAFATESAKADDS